MLIVSTLVSGCTDSHTIYQNAQTQEETTIITIIVLLAEKEIPESTEHITCSGSGAHRFLTCLDIGGKYDT
ncbi:hypothetical protein [Methanococcoides vulcani]|uniref:hypothetical protein n=1 Tax=Methanococcoides vulcani TaxID=1353158 RepID=UPI000B828933|nr:hypothetical protein [Methanococcoides vulcani]